jgi:hypothetical protein
MEDLEDAILAGLMKHPGEARDVTKWLSPAAFTGPRRELFTMIGEYARERRDIDPVTLAWGSAQANEARPAGTPMAEHEGWLRPEFVLQLDAMSTAPGAASLLGRSLLAERLYTGQHGPEWFRPRNPDSAPQARPSQEVREQAQDRVQRQAASSEAEPEQVRDRSPQRVQEPQDQSVRRDQRPPYEQRPQQDHQEEQRLRLYERAVAENRAPDGQDRVRASRQQGPYRQTRPETGNQPPVRSEPGNGPKNPPGRVVPGGRLVEHPPPGPSQDGMSQHR